MESAVDVGDLYAHYRQAMDGNPDAETALALTWDVLEAADQALGQRRKTSPGDGGRETGLPKTRILEAGVRVKAVEELVHDGEVEDHAQVAHD